MTAGPETATPVARERFDWVLKGLLPGIRVIPGRDAAKLRFLRAELAAIESACADLRAEFERVRGAARAEGHAEGYREGRADAVCLVTEAARFRSEMRETLSAEAIDLAFAIAKKILDREIDHDPAVFGDLVTLWRREACGSGPCTIKVNTADAAALDTERCGLDGATIVADPALQRGACRIDTGEGLFDTGFDARLEALKNASC